MASIRVALYDDPYLSLLFEPYTSLIIFAFSQPTGTGRPTDRMPLTSDFNDISGKGFDFIIAGGGTAGLTLAARLTEDPSVSVIVLEAGQANLDDPLITIPGQFAKVFGNPNYDWDIPTLPQKHSHNRVFQWQRGKGLGGSSAINFYAWFKPPAQDIDAIKSLGNPGWGWKEYFEYSKLVETYHPATQEQLKNYPHGYEPAFHGTNGPIQICLPHHDHILERLFQETMVNKGLLPVRDPYGGDITGTWIASANLDPRDWSRSCATKAYYEPSKDRQNLTVLTEATVSRVILEKLANQTEHTAKGVEFLHSKSGGGQRWTVHARKEVILSAGAVKTPQILELSGIGSPSVLNPLGIRVEVELPGVGENVQEHHYCSVSFQLRDDAGHETFDMFRQPGFAKKAMDLYKQGKGLHRIGVTSIACIPVSVAMTPEGAKKYYSEATENTARYIEEMKASGGVPPGLKDQLDIQLKHLKDESIPDFEIIGFPGFLTPVSQPEPGKSYVTMQFFLNHPLSRGSIHLASVDPSAHPAIDAGYFKNETDLENMVQQVNFIRSLRNIEPWASGIVKEMDPGLNISTDEQIRDYILNHHETSWHTIGSTSMLPRDKNGVVDPNLKVYGTSNLRVVDLGIIPLHIAAHTHATAFIVAEKAADIIRGVSRI